MCSWSRPIRHAELWSALNSRLWRWGPARDGGRRRSGSLHVGSVQLSQTPWNPGSPIEPSERVPPRLTRGKQRAVARHQPAWLSSWQDSGMERVLGIGGHFLRAADPVAVGAWYRDCLGLDADENGAWRQESGVTVFATFESETDYFGSHSQQAMLNFRVRDLDAMLAQLRAKGAEVSGETQEMEGVGRFGWVTDPEGNRVELWQPA
jgi:predicted enzyme related to lactoylglutathione lyase